MKARALASALVVAILASPLAAEAQRTAKVHRIGILSAYSALLREDAFRQGLRELGYIEGHSVLIESRHADGRLERLPELATDLVRLNVDVIVASPTEAVRAAQRATSAIPIVMAFSGDPVSAGLVSALAQPGGNVTGLTSVGPELSSKRLEFLKTIAPKVSRVAFLGTSATLKRIFDDAEAAGRALGLRVNPVIVDDANDLVRVFSSVKRAQAGAVTVDIVLNEQRRQIADLALKNRLPAISGPREFAEAGGLLAYGPDFADLFRRAAVYVDKIFRGAKPADLPVEQPTKFELVINLKTAKALGLTIPPSLLLRADQVIE